MSRPVELNGLTVLAASSLLSMVLGTVHGFSVFLVPLEQSFAASRSAVSLAYSLALIFITISVLFGHRIYTRWSAPAFVLVIAIIAAIGAILAGLATSLFWVWLGYGVIFGAANGFGYGFGLQFSAQSNPGREGVAMGVVTAAYALGAIFAPILFSVALEQDGFPLAMYGLAAIVMVAGVLSALLIKLAGTAYVHNAAAAMTREGSPPPIMRLWIGYGAASFAGLMIIGHAQGIAVSRGYSGANWHATALISAFNLVGSLLAGQMIDRTAVRLPLVVLPLLSMGAVFALVVLPGPLTMAVGLAIVGLSYGGIISAYPGAISKLFGPEFGPAIYGKVFTAWGTAGLAGPWVAGYLYDTVGTYGPSLWIAAAIAGLAAVAAYGLRSSH